MKIRNLEQLKNLTGQRVLLRVDFNVTMKGAKIIEDFRIDRSLPTIKSLLRQKAQIVLVAHLGRPKGKRVKKLSLAPIVKNLRLKLPKTKIEFIPDKFDQALLKKIEKSNAQIVVLENLRFDKREKGNDLKFAKYLASMADVYVNDAFAVDHRKAASLVAVTMYLPSYAGINLVDEVKYLSKALKPDKPAIALIGGVKLESKFPVIKNFLPKYSKVLVGGGIANLFLKAKGCDIGASVYDQKFLAKAKRLKSSKIVTPIDFVVADKETMKKVRYHQLKWGKDICDENEMILDIGPETIKKYSSLLKAAKTMVWAGPMGYIDMKTFAHGSLTMAHIIAARSSKKVAEGIAGGGETIAVLNQAKVGKYLDFISTGGGAMLQFLEGRSLPGIKPLIM